MPNESDNKRSIRSFVLRQGRMTKAQQQAFENNWQHYGIEYSEAVLDLGSHFSNPEQELVLEIGFGNGKSLAEMAQQSPEKNFIGIEVHGPGVGALLIEIEQRSLKNIKCIQHDAIEVLTHMIADNSVNAVQLFFPDPWPKKKHHKRRIVKNEFLNLLHQKLAANGRFHMATDWWPYAEDAMEVLSAYPNFINEYGETTFSKRPEFRPKTKFEERGERLGHGVWDLMFLNKA